MRQAPSLGGVQVPRGDGSTVIRLRRGASISDFADKIDANPASLVTVLFHLGEMATATQSLDEDTFGTLAQELGYIIEMVSAEEEDRELLGSFDIDLDAELADEEDEQLLARPPVVTVMGHVDHGKTKLLDAIRQTDVVAGEAGGITQHIGAYQVRTVHEGVDRAVTFIDTPGHEAFTAMRARGAQVTDIAILVVAADDGVMPQTIEALNHAQAAGVPIVVAVNKVDKEGANPAKIRQQLTEYNLVAEEYGGDTMFVDVSAKLNQGIDQLLEAVLLTADASLDLRANPNKDARGVVRALAPVATQFFVTRPDSERAREAEDFGDLVREEVGDEATIVFSDPVDALESAREWAQEEPRRAVVVTGSIVLVGAALTYAEEQQWKQAGS